jgi:hypothetical protein
MRRAIAKVSIFQKGHWEKEPPKLSKVSRYEMELANCC